MTTRRGRPAAEAFRTDFHLFDAYFHGVHGGTGKSFDWDLVAGRRSKVPMVLAGGLDARERRRGDRADAGPSQSTSSAGSRPSRA